MNPKRDAYRPRRSIQRQLIAGITAIHTLLMSLFLWDVLGRQQSFLIERAESRAFETARTLASSASALNSNGAFDDLQSVVRLLGASEGVVFAMVVDPEGEVLAHTGQHLIDKYLVHLPEVRGNPMPSRGMVIRSSLREVMVAVPVSAAADPASWVFVVKDLAPEIFYLERIRQTGLTYVLLAVLAGTLFAMLLSRLITRPLRKLLVGAQQFGAGTLTQPVPITTDNEIGVVTRAFNEAIGTVEQQRVELQEQSEFLKVLTDSLPVLISYVDAEERYLFNNQTYWDWFRLDPTSLKGQRVIDAVGPEAYKLIAPHIQRVLQGEPVRFEANLPYARGGTRAVDASYRPHKDTSGKVLGYFALTVDVTAHREAERKLKESEQRFRLLADSAPVMIWMNGVQREGTYFNRTWLEFTGRTLEEELGQGWLEGVHPQEADSALKIRTGAQKNRIPFTVQFRLRRADGVYRWLLDTGIPRFDEQGEFLGYIGSAMDITDRILIEAELREWKKRYEAAVRASDQLLYDWNPSTGELAWAGETERILGYRADELGHDLESWLDLIHPEDRPQFEHEVWRLRIEGVPTRLQYRVRRQDGRYIFVENRGDFTHDADGNVVRMIGFVEDVSNRKQAELTLQGMTETLEQRVLERTAEANQRATELRLMAMELTQAEQRERRRMAQVLHDDLQQLVAVAKLRIGRMKDFVEEEEGLGVLSDTDELLTQVIQTARTLSVELSPPMLQDRGLPAALEWVGRKFEQEQGLCVHMEAEQGATTNNVDTDLFVLQSVRELLFNICKHAGVEEAFVVLRFESPGQVLVEVRDAGNGFDAGEIDLRASSEHFGLFNIRQRVGFLGGSFSIDSVPGSGTTIRMLLPVALSTPIPEHAPRRTPVPLMAGAGKSKVKKTRVLLVDDHQIVRQGLAGLLAGQHDMQVVAEAGDGQSAIELARETRPDVIILDVSMPDMNGIEVARIIHEEFPAIRIIGLSMHEAEDMAIAMLEAGAAAYLPKDGPADHLIEVVRGKAAKE